MHKHTHDGCVAIDMDEKGVTNEMHVHVLLENAIYTHKYRPTQYVIHSWIERGEKVCNEDTTDTDFV